VTRHGLTRRLSRVEKVLAPRKELRVVLRFRGSGSEHFPQPTKEEIAGAHRVLSIVLVPTGDGRHAESQELDRSG